MTLPLSGYIAMSQVNTELQRTINNPITLNDGAVRALFGIPTGLIKLSDGYGKTNAFVFNKTISTDTFDYNLRADAVAAGWNQSIPLYANITIAGAATIGSTATYAPSFDTGAPFVAGSILTLTVNPACTILGMGGTGGGGNGGPGLRVQHALTVYNYGTIAGGGGGGGNGGQTVIITNSYSVYRGAAGGGGGAGRGYSGNIGSGVVGSSYNTNQYISPTAGGNSTKSNIGSGGGGAATNWGCPNCYLHGGGGGSGGVMGSNGVPGSFGLWTSEVLGTTYASGIGEANGTWTAYSVGWIYSEYGPSAGGTAGACTIGNSFINWASFGTRLGALT